MKSVFTEKNEIRHHGNECKVERFLIFSQYIRNKGIVIARSGETRQSLRGFDTEIATPCGLAMTSKHTGSGCNRFVLS